MSPTPPQWIRHQEPEPEQKSEPWWWAVPIAFGCATVLAGSVVIWTAFVYLIWRLFN